MPVLNACGWLIWLVKIAAEVSLALVLLKGRRWRQWPALVSFVCWSSAVSLWLLGIMLYDHATGCVGDAIPLLYFRSYWLGAAVAYLLEIWLILEIARAVCPVMGPWLNRCIPALALVFVIGCAIMGPDGRLVVFLSRAVSLGWLGTFALVGWGADALRLNWTRRELTISIGLTVLLLGDSITSIGLGLYPQAAQALSCFSAGIFIISTIIWARSFLDTGKIREAVLPLDAQEQEDIQDVLATTARRLRAE